MWTGASTDRGSQRFVGAKGYQNDGASGMQLLGARFYLPVLGRFLTQDPIGQGDADRWLTKPSSVADRKRVGVPPRGFRVAAMAGKPVNHPFRRLGL